jgi:hypothetical protein
MRTYHKGFVRLTAPSRVLAQKFLRSRQPDGTNVLSSVYVPIMILAALLTLPAPNRQRFRLPDASAFGAPLGRWKPTVDLDHGAPGPFSFVLDILNERRPTCVGNTAA